MRKAYLYCRKRQNPPVIEVLNFLFFRFILDYKYQNNVFNKKTSYMEALHKAESDFRFVYFFFIHPVYIGYLPVKRSVKGNISQGLKNGPRPKEVFETEGNISLQGPTKPANNWFIFSCSPNLVKNKNIVDLKLERSIWPHTDHSCSQSYCRKG